MQAAMERLVAITCKALEDNTLNKTEFGKNKNLGAPDNQLI